VGGLCLRTRVLNTRNVRLLERKRAPKKKCRHKERIELLVVFLGYINTREKQKGAPKMGESRITTRAFYKKITIFRDFRHAMSLRISSTFDSRAFQGI